jgi:hypothetical protein
MASDNGRLSEKDVESQRLSGSHFADEDGDLSDHRSIDPREEMFEKERPQEIAKPNPNASRQFLIWTVVNLFATIGIVSIEKLRGFSQPANRSQGLHEQGYIRRSRLQTHANLIRLLPFPLHGSYAICDLEGSIRHVHTKASFNQGYAPSRIGHVL